MEFEQGGHIRAEYGKALLTNLSRDLSLRHGKGFSRSNVIYMRLLYLHYAKGQKPSDLLSWSHHVELLRIDDPLERSFYEQQARSTSTPKNSTIATVERVPRRCFRAAWKKVANV